MSDIEVFSSAYRARLDEAERAGIIPENVSLEVSSPGVERVVRILQDLDRFKDRTMYVKYFVEAADETGTGLSSKEGDGVFRLVSFDLELRCCTWGIADVKINRDQAGKGRPLNKKQRDWRLNAPFHALRLVRLYSDV
ncbi:Ribosome maturation factor RimP [Macleaya cordata]|uniref:Ribosome maturation factor RimP n=1 Tax=Macleaya cordata TaxID=56857 RepID=A0A200QDY3_MACCD|nr:Ribosome maturation factor RimP [Macleaya cordata]